MKKNKEIIYDSCLDPKNNLIIDENTWVVAILRLPNGRLPEHSFLMVEGVKEGEIFFKRYDLFIESDADTHYQIKIRDQITTTENKAPSVLLNYINDKAAKGKAWAITAEKANQLHKNILACQRNPGRYNLLGDAATIPQTAAVSQNNYSSNASALFSRPPGENCFTWCRRMLYMLEIPQIKKDLPKKWEDIIASVTSRHLDNEASSVPKRNCVIM